MIRLDNLTQLFKTATLKQSTITLMGTLVNGSLGALFYIVLARFLGPVDFGLLIFSITVLTLLADIADIGISTGLVRFVSQHLKQESSLAFKFLKLSLEVKILIWILILLMGNILTPFIAENIFNKSELIIPLRLSLLGVGSALLFSFATASLQSFQKFTSWSVLIISTNLLRLLIIFMLIFNQQLNLQNSLLTYITMPFLGFFLSLFLLPTKSFINVSGEKTIIREFFNYNKWVATLILIAAFTSRLDIFLNTKLLSVQSVGVYAAASQLTSFIPQLVTSLGVVAAPKFASFSTNFQMINYLKKFQLLVIVLSLIGLLLVPLIYYLIPILLGSVYIASRDIFVILFLSLIIFLISVPIHSSILYYFSKPQIFVLSSLGQFVVITIVGLILIPSFGVIGTALAVLAGSVFNFVIPLLWLINNQSQKNEN